MAVCFLQGEGFDRKRERESMDKIICGPSQTFFSYPNFRSYSSETDFAIFLSLGREPVSPVHTHKGRMLDKEEIPRGRGH